MASSTRPCAVRRDWELVLSATDFAATEIRSSSAVDATVQQAPGSDASTATLYLIPDFGIGGGQVILGRTLAESTEGTHLVCGLRDGPMRSRLESDGVDCVVIGADESGHATNLARLVRLIRRERIDVIVSLNTPVDRSFAQLAGLLTGTPVAIWMMSLAVPVLSWYPGRGRELAYLKRRLLRPLNRVSARRAASLIALSDAVADSFADHLDVPIDDFSIVRPGLPEAAFTDIDDSRRVEIRSALDVADDHVVATAVGMLIEHKGQHHLIELMASLRDEVPQLRLWLVGDGPQRAELEAQIERHDLADRVKLLGHRSDVPDLLAASDILVTASRSEGFGMAVLEAMAARLPVVGLDTPAFAEFLDVGVTAELVEHVDELAAPLAQLARDGERREEMGRRARKIAEENQAARTAAELADVLGSVGATRATGLGRLGTRGLGLGRPTRPDPPTPILDGPGTGLLMSTAETSSAYHSGDVERPVQDAIVDLLGEGDVFYDVGANVGFFSLLAARAVGSAGSVVAFEPVAANAQLVRSNARANGMDNVVCIETAVSDRSGRADLHVARHPGGATLAEAGAPPDLEATRSVRAVSLDDALQSGSVPQPDVIKIDVEGAEDLVLAGMSDLMAESRPALVVEVDGPSDVDVDERAASIERDLESAGYQTTRTAPSYDIDWAVIHIVATDPMVSAQAQESR